MQRHHVKRALAALLWAPIACSMAPDDELAEIEAAVADGAQVPGGAAPAADASDQGEGEDDQADGEGEGDPGDDDGSQDDSPQPEDDAPVPPRLRVLLTDAPLPDVESVFVTFDEVKVQTCVASPPSETPESEDAGTTDDECEAGEWLTVVQETITLDLLTLQDGVTAELGLSALPEGRYGQIRLMLTDAAIAVEDEIIPLTVPSGVQSGLKLEHGFALQAGMETILTLDFDAEKSVHHAPGNGWMLKPVIAVIAETVAPIVDEPGESEPTEPDAETEPDADTEPEAETDPEAEPQP